MERRVTPSRTVLIRDMVTLSRTHGCYGYATKLQYGVTIRMNVTSVYTALHPGRQRTALSNRWEEEVTDSRYHRQTDFTPTVLACAHSTHTTHYMH